MNYDRDKVDEMELALLYLTITEENGWGARKWKSHDWDALDRLHARGYISDPKSKAKVGRAEPRGARTGAGVIRAAAPWPSLDRWSSRGTGSRH
jgi:Domain of unknown function (DUF6429)